MRKYTIIAVVLACLGAAELLYGQGRAVTASGIMYIRTLLTGDGSASAPPYSFATDSTSGIYRPSANNIGFTVGGTLRMQLGTINFDILSDSGILRLGASQDTILGRSSAGVFSVNSVSTSVFVTSDFSTTSVSLATITGLSWTLPANMARNVPFSCKLYYSQATAAVADAFGFQVATVAPTNAQVGGAVETALGTTAYGDATFTTTTAANVVTFTPSAISTIFNAYVDGFIEAPSNGSIATVNLMALTGNASDSITVKRGSFCRIY